MVSFAEIEKQARLEIRSLLEEWKKKPEKRSVRGSMAFQVLHSQFSGGGFPLLPWAIRMARRVVRFVR